MTKPIADTVTVCFNADGLPLHVRVQLTKSVLLLDYIKVTKTKDDRRKYVLRLEDSK